MCSTVGESDRKERSPLLVVEDLRTHFLTGSGNVPAVDGISFQLERGGALGIVGESGSGKSITSLSIMGLVPSPGRIVGGRILLAGRDLVQLREPQLRRMRGNEVAMVFQEPMTSLNPVFTIGYQIMEAVMLHQRLPKREARKKAVEMLQRVGLPAAERRMHEYPHQMSGGMRQRVMIAMALSCHPKLLIADEPTTALDVTIQAQILDLMRSIREEMDTALIWITHDLGVIAELVERVLVMYTGKIVEAAATEQLFEHPQHPYTMGLLASIPRLEQDSERLQAIRGAVPAPGRFPQGCGFHPRCQFAQEICRQKSPPSFTLDEGHQAACWRLVDYQD